MILYDKFLFLLFIYLSELNMANGPKRCFLDGAFDVRFHVTASVVSCRILLSASSVCVLFVFFLFLWCNNANYLFSNGCST